MPFDLIMRIMGVITGTVFCVSGIKWYIDESDGFFSILGILFGVFIMLMSFCK